MRKKLVGVALLLAIPLAIGGLVYGKALLTGQPQQAGAQGYTCPITGEELPCPLCCPLNKQGQQVASNPAAAEGYTCPITGEELPCPLCCPLNRQK
jgi:hypothetical protein